MSQTAKHIGLTLRKARRDCGRSRQAVASACCMSVTTVKLLEQGNGMCAQADRVCLNLDRRLVVRAASQLPRHCALVQLRQRRGLSQRDLARLSGVARNTLARLERGDDVGLFALCSVGAMLGAGLSVLPAASVGRFFATTAQGSGYHGWHTPAGLFDRVEMALGPFHLDPCAPADGASPVRATVRFTEADDGLTLDWFGRVFMNPPYGRSLGAWVGKARAEAARGCLVAGLVPARTDTAWWHQHIAGAAHVVFLRGRLAFGGQSRAAPFPSAVAVWGSSPDLLDQLRACFPEAFIAPRDVA